MEESGGSQRQRGAMRNDSKQASALNSVVVAGNWVSLAKRGHGQWAPSFVMRFVWFRTCL